MKGKKIELTIDGYDSEGRGLAKLDGKVYFVQQALDGEKIIAKVIEEHKSYSIARVSSLIESSKNRVDIKCPYYFQCGGCDLFHMNYEEELKFKHDKVSSSIASVAKIDIDVDDTIPNNKGCNYRNKVLVPFQFIDNDIKYGFYKPKSHDLVQIEDCLIENENAKFVLAEIKNQLRKNDISIYNEEKHQGLFRGVMLRFNYINEAMVVLISTKDNEKYRLIANELVAKFSFIKSVMLNINDKKTNVMLSYDYKNLALASTIKENILGNVFEVSPASFLQVNHDMCEKLYSKALEYLDLNKDMNVIDAYCGIGSISLCMAKNAKHVYGIEIVESAIENAKKNAMLNNIENTTFHCGKCEDVIKKLVNEVKIDAICFDPPRKGCDIEFLNSVIEMKIPKIVYISCKISTAARDIKILNDAGYELKKAVPVDLFTHSNHVESVCLLSLEK